jgi:toxin HigB-1
MQTGPLPALDARNPIGYTPWMIVRFRHKGLERLFTTGDARGVSTRQVRKIVLVLAQLNIAMEPAEMNVPGLRFHAPGGDRRGNMPFRSRGIGGLCSSLTAVTRPMSIWSIITNVRKGHGYENA